MQHAGDSLSQLLQTGHGTSLDVDDFNPDPLSRTIRGASGGHRQLPVRCGACAQAPSSPPRVVMEDESGYHSGRPVRTAAGARERDKVSERIFQRRGEIYLPRVE
jgi:hypothetical protein